VEGLLTAKLFLLRTQALLCDLDLSLELRKGPAVVSSGRLRLLEFTVLAANRQK
jgi:hypothetical protein